MTHDRDQDQFQTSPWLLPLMTDAHLGHNTQISSWIRCCKYFLFRRHKCRHNPGAGNKSSILPLEDDRGNIIGERMTKEEKVAFERRHSQVGVWWSWDYSRILVPGHTHGAESVDITPTTSICCIQQCHHGICIIFITSSCLKFSPGSFKLISSLFEFSSSCFKLNESFFKFCSGLL